MKPLIVVALLELLIFISPALAQKTDAGLVKANIGSPAAYMRGVRNATRLTTRRKLTPEQEYDFEKAPQWRGQDDIAVAAERGRAVEVKPEPKVRDRPLFLENPQRRINIGVQAEGGPDPMVAVGDRTIVVANFKWIKFFDKKTGSMPLSTNATALFWKFLNPEIQEGPQTGQPNPEYISNHLDIPADVPYWCGKERACKTGPIDPISGNRLPCTNLTDEGLVQTGYDVRVYYQKEHKRFVIVAALKNETSRDNDDYNRPPTRDCSKYLARFVGIAVSLTEDPNDGFHVFRTRENNFRDWPRVVVDQDYLTLAHNGGGENSLGNSIVTVYSFRAMKDGLGTVSHFTIPQVPNGPVAVVPVANLLTNHMSQTQFFVEHANAADGIIKILYFKKPADPAAIFQNPPTSLTTAGIITVPGARFSGGAFAGITYFDENIYTVSYQKFATETFLHRHGYGLNFFRIPVIAKTNGHHEATVVGLEHNVFKDADYSFSHPSLAMDLFKNVVIQFIRIPRDKNSSEKPQLRYKIKFAGNPDWNRSKLVQEWTSFPATNKKLVDYSWITKDPFELAHFWHAHAHAVPGKAMWVGRINLGIE
jgi:hypothetical protein